MQIPVTMDAGDAIDESTKLRKKIDDVGDAAKRTSKDGGKLGATFELLGKGALVAGGLAVGLGVALFEMAKNAGEDEQNMNRLMRTVENSGAAYDGAAADVEAFIRKQQQLAFTDDEVRESLNLLVTQTGDLGEAMELQATASDLARFGNIDLEKATRLLLKADAESYAALGKLGIRIDENATKEEALQAVREATAGQAEEFASSTAGTLMRIQDSVGEAFETVGAAILPLVEGPLKAFADWLQSPEVQQGITDLATAVGTFLTDAFKTLQSILDVVVPIIKPFAEAFMDFFSTIQSGTPFMDALGNLFGDLGKAVSGAWDVIGPALGDLIKNVWNWITENAPTILAKLGEWAIAFGTWVWQDAIPFLFEELGKLIKAVWDWIVENGPKILAELGKWAMAFWDWAAGVARDLPTHLAPIAQAIWDWFTGVDRELPAKTHLLATRFGEMPADAVAQLTGPTGFPVIGDAIARFIVNTGHDMGEMIFAHWVPAMWNWVVDVVKGIPGKLEYIWETIIAAVKAFGPRLFAGAVYAGKEFVEGLRDGIARMWATVVEWLRAKIAALIAMAREALDGVLPGGGGNGARGATGGRGAVGVGGMDGISGVSPMIPNGALVSPAAAAARGGVVVQVLVDGRAWSLTELSERLGLQIRLQTAGG